MGPKIVERLRSMNRRPSPALGVEDDVWKLVKRCRARERAVEHLSAAVVRLRRANGALTEENALLRLEIERLEARANAGSQ
jgi:hypothetical protein